LGHSTIKSLLSIDKKVSQNYTAFELEDSIKFDFPLSGPPKNFLKVGDSKTVFRNYIIIDNEIFENIISRALYLPKRNPSENWIEFIEYKQPILEILYENEGLTIKEIYNILEKRYFGRFFNEIDTRLERDDKDRVDIRWKKNVRNSMRTMSANVKTVPEEQKLIEQESQSKKWFLTDKGKKLFPEKSKLDQTLSPLKLVTPNSEVKEGFSILIMNISPPNWKICIKDKIFGIRRGVRGQRGEIGDIALVRQTKDVERNYGVYGIWYIRGVRDAEKPYPWEGEWEKIIDIEPIIIFKSLFNENIKRVRHPDGSLGGSESVKIPGLRGQPHLSRALTRIKESNLVYNYLKAILEEKREECRIPGLSEVHLDDVNDFIKQLVVYVEIQMGIKKSSEILLREEEEIEEDEYLDEEPDLILFDDERSYLKNLK